MSEIGLGFLTKCENWRLKSHQFPSKVGGKPAWLSLTPLPSAEELTCEKCNKIMIFLMQIYAQLDESEDNFHRTLFVFICRDAKCNEAVDAKNIKVFRSTLRRNNDFYPFEPPLEKETEFDVRRWTDLCELCGAGAHQQCSKCKKVAYCCRDHQVTDWKSGHKNQCSTEGESECNSNFLFDEFELVIEDEEPINNETHNNTNAMKEFEKLKAEGKTGTLEDADITDLEAHAISNEDRVFSKFKKRISKDPDQVLRYWFGGEPLYIAKQPIPSNIPNCEHCGGERQFEFQIMPQLLYEIKENTLDWGVLLIYTCKSSCIGDSINSYKKEFVFRQDVSADNNI